MSTNPITIPQEIYESDQACGEFIIAINEKLAEVAKLERSLKEAKEKATSVMLDRLEITGLKHFAFDFGTFAKTTKTFVSFPTAESGGKEAAAQWLHDCYERGVIEFDDILNVQQARVSTEPLLAIEEAVREYNERNALDPQFVPIADSPFNRYEQTTLTTPRKRKG